MVLRPHRRLKRAVATTPKLADRIPPNPVGADHPPVAPDESRPAHRGMIVRQAEPLNVEMPFGALDQFTTRTEVFLFAATFRYRKFHATGGGFGSAENCITRSN